MRLIFCFSSSSFSFYFLYVPKFPSIFPHPSHPNTKKILLDIPVDTIEIFNVSTEKLNEDNEVDESAEEDEEEEEIIKEIEKEEEEEVESIDDLWTESKDDKGIDVTIPQLDKGQVITDELNEMAALRQVSLESEVTTAKTATTSTSTDVETLNSSKRQIKVSTACGPSPDREIEEIFSNEKSIRVLSPAVMRENQHSRSSKVSIGTSPPPQNMSTQVRKLLIFFITCSTCCNSFYCKN